MLLPVQSALDKWLYHPGCDPGLSYRVFERAICLAQFKKPALVMNPVCLGTEVDKLAI
jgi:hypothetical protein